VLQRVRAIMTCGMTPHKIALTICLGTAVGLLPLLWGTSLLCILLAQIFRLNHVALQSVNYLFYPLQLALLVPFFKLGDWLFPWGPPVPSNMLASLISSPSVASLHLLGWITCKSLAAWLVTALPATLLAYGIFRSVSHKATD
jgi:uncharacterized protein (DUF2062 family)